MTNTKPSHAKRLDHAVICLASIFGLNETPDVNEVQYIIHTKDKSLWDYEVEIRILMEDGVFTSIWSKHEQFYSYWLERVPQNDKKLIGRILSSGTSRNVFNGSKGAALIKDLCLTNNLYIDTNEIPLKYCNVNSHISFSWNKRRGDSCNYYLSSDRPKNLIFQTNPVISYIDGLGGVFPFSSDYSNATLLKFLHTESLPIHKDKLSKIYLDMDYKITDDFVQPPRFLESHYKTRPTPILKITAIEDSHYSHRVRLFFKYGVEILEYSPRLAKTNHICMNSGNLTIRNLRFENECWRDFVYLDIDINFDYSDRDNYKYYSYIIRQPHNSKKLTALNYKLNDLQQKKWKVELKGSNGKKGSFLEPKIKAQTMKGKHWLAVCFTIEYHGKSFILSEIVNDLKKKYGTFKRLPKNIKISLGPHSHISLPRDILLPSINVLNEFKDRIDENGTIQLHKNNFPIINEFNKTFVWGNNNHFLNQVDKIRKGREKCKSTISQHFQGILKSYQETGFKWLSWLIKCSFGGVLADDMGVGKTVQSIAAIDWVKHVKKVKRPVLILAPVSLLDNWIGELEKFCPKLRCYKSHGVGRCRNAEQLKCEDVIITSYKLLIKDIRIYSEIDFCCTFIDEAQNVNNPQTQIYKSIESLSLSSIIALTGTPVENDLKELWSIFNLVNPGLLGSKCSFTNRFIKPITNTEDEEALIKLQSYIEPFILRRLKADVVQSLPIKSLEVIKVELSNEEKVLYETIRSTVDFEQAPSKILNTISKLKQLCCHASLLKNENVGSGFAFSKIDAFMELITYLLKKGKRVLVFSQYRSMLEILYKHLKSSEISSLLLSGKSKNRANIVKDFEDKKANVFLISLKAGGVGLNLTSANSVIHYDSWWNCAAENQATDRAYRIGQNEDVDVFKLVCSGTIEELILELQNKKETLQESIYSLAQNNDIIRHLTSQPTSQ